MYLLNSKSMVDAVLKNYSLSHEGGAFRTKTFLTPLKQQLHLMITKTQSKWKIYSEFKLMWGNGAIPFRSYLNVKRAIVFLFRFSIYVCKYP